MAFLAQKLISASGPKEETDDDFNLVTGLYHFDGTNGAYNHANTSFNSASSGSGNINPYPAGVVGQGTFSPFSADEGKWGVQFSRGNPDYLTLNDSDFSFGTGDFTIECFVFFETIATTGQGLFQLSNGTLNAQDGRGPAIGTYNGTGKWHIYYGAGETQNNTVGSAIAAPDVGKWIHVAYVRTSGTIKIFIDGTQIGSDISYTGNYTDTYFTVGGWYGSLYTVGGRLSNFRVVNGTAVYTSNFTVPTTPLTDITNTKLLTCRSNRIFDASGAANTVTVGNGAPFVQPFSPLAPSASYNAAVNGGSVNFEAVASGYVADLWGSLNLTSLTFGTGDFTIEAWIYKTVNGESTIYNGSYHTAQQSPRLIVTSSNKLSFLLDTTAQATSSADVPLYMWTHVAVSKASSTGYLLMNGAQVGTWSDSHDYPSPYLYYFFGCNATQNGSAFVGNFAARILKGTGLYTGSYTVPTSPFTDITNTVTLLNGAGGALFDQTGKTNLITVGNAQLSTSFKKFGTASAKFDHTGDYLKISRSSFIPIGLGDFTIECFAYFAATPVGDGQGLFQLSNGYLNSQVRGPAAGAEGNNGKWTMFAGTTQYTHTSVPSTGTWYHVAQVRNSGTTKLYIDGTEILSASDSTNYTDNYFIIGGWYSGDYLLNGYIDEFRISFKARYTSNFTAPTEEFANR